MVEHISSGTLNSIISSSMVFLQVHVEDSILIKPPPRDREILYLHNGEQQTHFPVEALYGYNAAGSPDSTGEVVDIIREAVRRSLDSYYFVAGRLRFNDEQLRVELDCNGAGVLFAGAACDFPIQELHELRKPDASLRKLIVYPLEIPRDLSEALLVTIQVTRFSCGGFVVGISSNHIIYDGVSGYDFYNTIAKIARGEEATITPNPDRTWLLPNSPPKPTHEHPELLAMPDNPARLVFKPHLYDSSLPGTAPNVSFKIFSFTPEMLSRLKKLAMEDGTLTRPCSSFEALTAHVWRARTRAAMEHQHQESEISKLFVIVNVRGQMKNPPLPHHFSGNSVVASPCVNTTARELLEKPLSFSVRKVQACISGADESFVRSMVDWCELNHGLLNVPGGLIITTWNKLPFHELDFGWGKPFYAAPVVHDRTEYAVFISNCRGDGGVDVFMGIEFDKMAKLEEYLIIGGNL